MRCLPVLCLSLSLLLPSCDQMPADGQPDGRMGTASGTDTVKSGSRIKVQYMVTDDGAQIQAGAYDSKLGFVCTFEPLFDGSVRCLPLHLSLTVFTDSVCKNMVQASAVAGYVKASDNKIGGFRVYETDTTTLGSAYYLAGAVCAPYPKAYAAKRELAPGELVAGHLFPE